MMAPERSGARRVSALVARVLVLAVGPTAAAACGQIVGGGVAPEDVTPDASTSDVSAAEAPDTAVREDAATPPQDAAVDTGPCTPASVDAAGLKACESRGNSRCAGPQYYDSWWHVPIGCSPKMVPGSCYFNDPVCADYCGVRDGAAMDLARIECEICQTPEQTPVVACGATFTTLGRRGEGFRASPMGVRSSLAAFLSSAAELESASVDAFHVLRNELSAHGAPAALVRRAERSAADEVRHARIMGRLARRHGGTPRAARVDRRCMRSLATIALENAVEGCVRETYGALVAAWQSRRAQDPELRRAMAAIARDEARHAALAWDVASFCDERLSTNERAAVRAARHAAMHALRAELAYEPSAGLTRDAGVPSRADAIQLWKVLASAA
jgi:hypothetical protein